jgi:hypothetical protein
MRWGASNAQRSAYEQESDVQVAERALDAEGRKYRHAEEIAWLTALLDKTDSEYEQRTILRSIEWLKEEPNRTLAPSFRQQFRALEYRLGMQARGIAPKRKLGSSPRGFNPYANALRRAAAKDRKAAREAQTQDWERDPSKLPKKPPGAASGGA